MLGSELTKTNTTNCEMVTPTNAAFSEGRKEAWKIREVWVWCRGYEGMRQHRHMSKILSRRQSLWAIFSVPEDKTRSLAKKKKCGNRKG